MQPIGHAPGSMLQLHTRGHSCDLMKSCCKPLYTRVACILLHIFCHSCDWNLAALDLLYILCLLTGIVETNHNAFYYHFDCIMLDLLQNIQYECLDFCWSNKCFKCIRKLLCTKGFALLKCFKKDLAFCLMRSTDNTC